MICTYKETESTAILESEVRNGSSKGVQIIADNSKRAAILDNHVGRSHGAQRVNHQSTSGAFDTEDLALAILGSGECGAGSAVVVEEAVQPGSINNEVLAVEHAETQGVAISPEAAAVAGVIQGRVGWVRAVRCVGVGLIVPE